MVDLVLFPSSYFSILKVDEDLQAEYEAVKTTGLFDISFFGYDKWINEDILWSLTVEYSKKLSQVA